VGGAGSTLSGKSSSQLPFLNSLAVSFLCFLVACYFIRKFKGTRMGKYRSKLQIIADILLVASKAAKKTWIMYQANLSYALLNRYLAEVTDAGLVSFVGSGDCYKITRKGREFLDKFSEYFERRRQLEEQINGMNSEKMDLEKMVHSRITE